MEELRSANNELCAENARLSDSEKELRTTNQELRAICQRENVAGELRLQQINHLQHQLQVAQQEKRALERELQEERHLKEEEGTRLAPIAAATSVTVTP